MTQADWDKASSAALSLFAFGQAEAAKRGLLLVDTKYELGKDAEGNILLLDEVSQWWGMLWCCVCGSMAVALACTATVSSTACFTFVLAARLHAPDACATYALPHHNTHHYAACYAT